MADPHDICSQARWDALCGRLGLSADANIYAALIAAHAERHRAYHTLDHIAACLRHLDDVKDLTDRPDEIEMAFWFHDAVYKPFSATNEEDSADWAASWLAKVGCDPAVMNRIHTHIIATKSHDTPPEKDGQFMLDIDLSILGTPPHVYDQFEKDVRFEYRRVPGFMFRKKRKEILQGFLDRAQIYATDIFRDKLETQARENLSAAIARL